MKPVLLITLVLCQFLSFSQTNSISSKNLKESADDESDFGFVIELLSGGKNWK